MPLVQNVFLLVVFLCKHNSSFYKSSFFSVAAIHDAVHRIFGASYRSGPGNTDAGETPSGSVISSNLVNKTWLVSEALAGGSVGTLVLTWNSGDEIGGFNRSICNVSHFTGGGWHSGVTGNATGSNPYSQSLTNITSFSPFGIASSGSPLPIQLISFTGVRHNYNIELNWITGSENGLLGFDVERSDDGKSFSRIGNTKANNQSQNNYRFTDADIPSNAPELMYRLRMNELSGNNHYSNTVMINTEQSGIVTIYPNPVNDDLLYLNMAKGFSDKLTITIIDGAGKKYNVQTVNADDLKSGVVPVSVKGLLPGVYLLQLTNENGEVQSVRFSRQ